MGPKVFTDTALWNEPCLPEIVLIKSPQRTTTTTLEKSKNKYS